MKHLLLGLLLAGTAGLVGCSSTGTTTSNEEEQVELQSVEEEKPSDAQTSGASQTDAEDAVKFGSSGMDRSSSTTSSSTYRGHPLDNPDSILVKKTVYFDFDKSDIKGEGKVILDAHAEYLVTNPSARIRIEGHCDERGTREYNVALGERRAASVKRYLTLKGVSTSQLNMVSYGEERPAAMGHDESAWSLNRRAELVYTTR